MATVDPCTTSAFRAATRLIPSRITLAGADGFERILKRFELSFRVQDHKIGKRAAGVDSDSGGCGRASEI